MNRNCPTLYIVVPCYNEEQVLPESAKLFLEQLQSMTDRKLVHPDSRILFADDCSKDESWRIIRELAEKDPRFLGIRQSRNRGQQSTLLAGLMEAKEKADIIISIDCDGQDDPAAMGKMVEAYLNGCDVVYGIRSDRKSDTFFKRTSAQVFYRLLWNLGAEVVYNHGDYRLLSRRVVRALGDCPEGNLYLRGMIPMIGFSSTCVEYTRRKRIAGKSHYSLSRMLGLAVDGITSFSTKPLRIITALGMLISLVSFIGVLWAVITRLQGNSVAGWASTVAIVCFMGGVQLISTGVLGEYIGKIYMETKKRPRYIISDRTEE